MWRSGLVLGHSSGDIWLGVWQWRFAASFPIISDHVVRFLWDSGGTGQVLHRDQVIEVCLSSFSTGQREGLVSSRGCVVIYLDIFQWSCASFFPVVLGWVVRCFEAMGSMVQVLRGYQVVRMCLGSRFVEAATLLVVL